MAKRNMRQIIEETKIPDHYDMTSKEWMELAREQAPDAVRDAFKYGFALGMRYQKNKDKGGARK